MEETSVSPASEVDQPMSQSSSSTDPSEGLGSERNEDEDETPPAYIDILPDELLENIFGRISPYNDLDNVKAVCHRWNRVALNLSKAYDLLPNDIEFVASLRLSFEKSFIDGRLHCEKVSAAYDDSNRVVGAWISERFGHMCCYYDRSIYVIGGTTHTPTTFNDMWQFDLSTRSWGRCITAGKYPTPKALASVVQYKDNFVLFGGWAHPPPYPLMQPWKIFDELHIYNVPTKKWSQVITGTSPHPCAGHSASVHGDLMVVFGGRTFNQKEQSYPISNEAWVFSFLSGEWYQMVTNEPPQARYGQTQVRIDDSHALVIGGCGGPNQIFSDVWLLEFECNGRRFNGTWTKLKTRNPKSSMPHDFHYAGCRIGSSVVFCERSSPRSPFLAFLHFDNSTPPDAQPHAYQQPENVVFEASHSRSYFHSRCSSGLRQQTTASMPIYSLDISKVLSDGEVEWTKEPEPLTFGRPKERLLYSMVAGRGELIIFGGFFKDPNGMACRVSNDVFILKTIRRNY